VTVEIDPEKATCALTVQGLRYERPIGELRVTTDPDARMSLTAIDGMPVYLSEDQAEQLIAAGAIDERFNLIVDDE
jgi:hypothetical protein